MDYFCVDVMTEFENCSQNTRSGVFFLFIKDGLKYFIREDFNHFEHPLNLEPLAEIERPRSNNIIIGITYRSPDQDIIEFNHFNLRLQNMKINVPN